MPEEHSQNDPKRTPAAGQFVYRPRLRNCTVSRKERRAFVSSQRSCKDFSSIAIASVLVATWAARPALADEPSPRPAPLASDTATPAKTAPDEPRSVPSPSPVVLGGKPTPEEWVGLPLGWDWSRFSIADYVITGTAGAITLAAAILHPIKNHSLQGGILFDDAVRNSLRSSDIQTRYAFRDASDVGLSFAATWPFFVDSLATAWWYRGSRHAAQEMALLDLETLAIAGAAQGVTNVLVSRQRPYGQYCGTPQLPSAALDCNGIEEYRSFFSGHATFTFTSAALICINHHENALLGSPWDQLTCAGSYAVAASTATLRVLADVHYATDVLTGALVGTLIGYGVPLLHYHHIGTLSAGGMTLQLAPSVGGAGLVGTF